MRASAGSSSIVAASIIIIVQHLAPWHCLTVDRAVAACYKEVYISLAVVQFEAGGIARKATQGD